MLLQKAYSVLRLPLFQNEAKYESCHEYQFVWTRQGKNYDHFIGFAPGLISKQLDKSWGNELGVHIKTQSNEIAYHYSD